MAPSTSSGAGERSHPGPAGRAARSAAAEGIRYGSAACHAPGLPPSSFSNFFGSQASGLFQSLCRWAKYLTLYEETTISDTNCLHFPILYLKNFRIFYSPRLLCFQFTGYRKHPLSVLSSQASLRTWLRQLFLPAVSLVI